MCTVRFKNKDDWKASKQYSLTESTFSLAESRVCRQNATKISRDQRRKRREKQIMGTYLFVLIHLVGADWHVAVGDTFWNVVPVLPGNKWTTSFKFFYTASTTKHSRATYWRRESTRGIPPILRIKLVASASSASWAMHHITCQSSLMLSEFSCERRTGTPELIFIISFVQVSIIRRRKRLAASLRIKSMKRAEKLIVLRFKLFAWGFHVFSIN